MADPPALIPPQTETSSVKMVLVMGSVGLIASILLVATYQLTIPRIEANRQAQLEAAVLEVVPGAVRFVPFAPTDTGGLAPVAEGAAPGLTVYAAYDGAGSLAGVAIEASGQGYADVVRILYGYDPGCDCVVGMKVLESKETPGLGDKIGKDAGFLANFEALAVSLAPDGERLANDVVLVKHGTKSEAWQIEAITGATISSQAVTDIIRASTGALIGLIERNVSDLDAPAPPAQP